MQVKKLVKVKELKDIDVDQHPHFYRKEMESFCGTIIQVTYLARNMSGDRVYSSSGYNWNENWFEEIDTPLSNILYK